MEYDNRWLYENKSSSIMIFECAWPCDAGRQSESGAWRESYFMCHTSIQHSCIYIDLIRLVR